jgi:hypothetical protein
MVPHDLLQRYVETVVILQLSQFTISILPWVIFGAALTFIRDMPADDALGARTPSG